MLFTLPQIGNISTGGELCAEADLDNIKSKNISSPPASWLNEKIGPVRTSRSVGTIPTLKNGLFWAN